MGDSESILHLTLETVSGADDVDEAESKPINSSEQRINLQRYMQQRRVEGTAFLAKNKIFMLVKPDILTYCKAEIEAVDIVRW